MVLDACRGEACLKCFAIFVLMPGRASQDHTDEDPIAQVEITGNFKSVVHTGRFITCATRVDNVDKILQ